jgi:hypothetical protein
VELVAGVVANLDQALRIVVKIFGERAVRLNDLTDQARRLIFEASDPVVGFARRVRPAQLGRSQPASRIVLQVGDDAIGVLARQRTTEPVVT